MINASDVTYVFSQNFGITDGFEMVHAGPIKIVKWMPYPCLFLHHNGVKGRMSPDSMDKITFLIKTISLVQFAHCKMFFIESPLL